MTDDSQDEPKLIIDEDWKTQVEREREELKRKAEQEASAAPTAADAPEAPADAPEAAADAPEAAADASGESEEIPPPPPASFSFLLTSLATQAMAALGQMPGEDGQPMPVNLEYARHFIDLMGVLEEKTTGNLEDEEKSFLQETLHQMRMLFVAVSQQTENQD